MRQRFYMIAPILLFLATLPFSLPTIHSPLNLRFDWLTAHTIISLSFYKKCSPAPYLGASIMMGTGPELDCKSPMRAEPDQKPVYLSYPSAWLDVLIPFRSWLISKDLNQTIVRIRWFTLLAVRLLLIAALLGITLQFTSGTTDSFTRYLLCVAASIPVVFSPGFLHFSQNTYFADIVTVPVTLILLFRFASENTTRSFSSRIIDFFLGCAAASMAWLGALAVLVVIGRGVASAIRQKLWAQFFARYTGLILGAVAAASFYLYQVALFDPELKQIHGTFLQRLEMGAPDGTASFGDFLGGFAAHANGFAGWSPLNRLPLVFLVGCVAIPLWIFIRGNRRQKKILLLIWLPPTLHLLIFTQHSYIHDFSPFKWVGVFILCGVFLFSNTLRYLQIFINPRPAAILVLAAMIGIAAHSDPGKRLRVYSLFSEETAEAAWSHERLVKTLGGSDRVLIALDEDSETSGWLGTKLSALPWPPLNLAAGGRQIYTPALLRSWLPVWADGVTLSLKPTFIAFSSEMQRSGDECEGRWHPTNIRIFQRVLYSCEDERTIQRYMDTTSQL
ncbi:MAG: hypothetical protein KDK37_00705 [Leptospiraceae bacterium]|nr:hypothetical protein [Leptospiraceae bacterium]